MSVELPEAYILARQMKSSLSKKQVVAVQLQDCAKFQKLGFVNKESSNFGLLIGGSVQDVISRGTVMLLKLDNDFNLLLAPEYGGKVFVHEAGDSLPSKYNLKLSFSDGAFLTVALSGMGVIQALSNDKLTDSYVYRRDFSNVATPIEEKLSHDDFSEELSSRNVNLKTVIVGKEAVYVGLGNSIFQDIIFLAGIHPRRKASELLYDEKKRLFDSLKFVIHERIKLGGKDEFQDLFGKWGLYKPAMGSNMKNCSCSNCGGAIDQIVLGGGQVYYCRNCQT